MNVLHVHYYRSNGEIEGWENSPEPIPRDGCDIITVEMPPGFVMPDPKLQKVEDGKLADKSDAERERASLPTEAELQAAIAGELRLTDAYMMPDRPLSDAERAAWISYRQSLRDLSRLATPADRLAAWPTRPQPEKSR